MPQTAASRKKVPPLRSGAKVDHRRGKPRRADPSQSFQRMVRIDADSGCWLWQGATNPEGYGRFRVGGQLVYAHRWSYEQVRGPIPSGLQLDHLCRTPRCVNPSHLEAVSSLENTLRGTSHIAVARRREHCINGHEWTEANTYIRLSRAGSRECRQCHAEKEARRQAERKAR